MTTYDMDTLKGQIEAAFDYRGNVTITFIDGQTYEGFVFNRNLSSRSEPPFIEVYPMDKTAVPIKFRADLIQSITLTGEDTAAGKSWDAWLEKQKKVAPTGS